MSLRYPLLRLHGSSSLSVIRTFKRLVSGHSTLALLSYNTRKVWIFQCFCVNTPVRYTFYLTGFTVPHKSEMSIQQLTYRLFVVRINKRDLFTNVSKTIYDSSVVCLQAV